MMRRAMGASISVPLVGRLAVEAHLARARAEISKMSVVQQRLAPRMSAYIAEGLEVVHHRTLKATARPRSRGRRTGRSNACRSGCKWRIRFQMTTGRARLAVLVIGYSPVVCACASSRRNIGFRMRNMVSPSNAGRSFRWLWSTGYRAWRQASPAGPQCPSACSTARGWCRAAWRKHRASRAGGGATAVAVRYARQLCHQRAGVRREIGKLSATSHTLMPLAV